MTKTTRKNIVERLNEITKSYKRTVKKDRWDDEAVEVTKEQFENICNEIWSNLGSDLKKNLRVDKNNATGKTMIGTCGYTYMYFVVR